jgi:hypothetical protein
MDRETRRSHALTRFSRYSELSAEEYGRLLYLRNPDKYMRLCIAMGFYPSDEECEDLCANLFREVFKQVGKCTYHHIEVEFGTWTVFQTKSKPLFRITYARRPKR